MALRFSTGFVNGLVGGVGYYELMNGGKVEVYTGTQPSTADTSPSGTLLFTGTLSSGTHTVEVKATCVINFTGFGGSITAFKIGSVPIINTTVDTGTSVANAANNLATGINSYYSYPDYFAVSDGVSAVTIYAPKGSGTALNSLPVNVTFTTATMTCNGVSVSTGVDTTTTALFGSGSGGSAAGVAAVNGVTFTYPPTSGTLAKSGTWTGTAVATGTAGWFRFKGGNYRTNAADSDATDTTTYLIRMDGSIGTSGTDMTVANTSITSGASQTINTFSLILPQT